MWFLVGSGSHGCHAGMYEHDYRADDSHRPVDNRQWPTSVLQQLDYGMAGHARAKIKQVIEELQDACAFAMMSRCSSAAPRCETPACAAAVVHVERYVFCGRLCSQYQTRGNPARP